MQREHPKRREFAMHYRWSSISTVGVLIPFLALTLPACETSSGSAPRTAGEPRSTPTSTTATTSTQQTTAPIVQEQMQIEKREVQGGTTRLEQRTNEQPAEQQVTLHDEKVNVEQRATDRSVTDADRAFQQSASAQAWSTLEPDFRKNYRTTYANAGMSYEQVQTAYRYGYELALNPQIDAADWNAIEPQAKQSWESRRKGSWDQYRDAVRYGWERTRRAKE
jgi:hypothetical protein